MAYAEEKADWSAKREFQRYTAESKKQQELQAIEEGQMEWSLQSRALEKEVVPCARRLGVGIVAYSPLGRCVLSESESQRVNQ